MELRQASGFDVGSHSTCTAVTGLMSNIIGATKDYMTEEESELGMLDYGFMVAPVVLEGICQVGTIAVSMFDLNG
jgi:hypothetical protein